MSARRAEVGKKNEFLSTSKKEGAFFNVIGRIAGERFEWFGLGGLVEILPPGSGFQQYMGKVHEVVGQCPPQRLILHLRETPHRHGGKAPSGAQIRVDGL